MTKSADELKKLGADNKDKLNSAVSTMRGSLFFSLDELPPTYTANEVVQLLMDFGHCPVPEQFQDVYVRKTNTSELAERYQALGRRQKEEPTRRQEVRPVEDKQTTSTPPLPHIPDDVHVVGPSGCDYDDDFGGPFQELESSPEINQTQRKGRKGIGSFISDDLQIQKDQPTRLNRSGNLLVSGVNNSLKVLLRRRNLKRFFQTWTKKAMMMSHVQRDEGPFLALPNCRVLHKTLVGVH